MTRKCQCAGGWDWGPCMMTNGIYGSICIKTVKDGLFDSLTVSYTHDKNIWKAHINAVFDSFINGKKDFSFSINEENKDDVASLKVSKDLLIGKNDIEAELTVTNPFIWKTSTELKEEGLKENILYDLSVKENDSLTDEIKTSKKICFSTLRTVSEKDIIDGKPGRSFYFENNGRKYSLKVLTGYLQI